MTFLTKNVLVKLFKIICQLSQRGVTNFISVPISGNRLHGCDVIMQWFDNDKATSPIRSKKKKSVIRCLHLYIYRAE